VVAVHAHVFPLDAQRLAQHRQPRSPVTEVEPNDLNFPSLL
jgi:hypothetical protein